MNRAMRASLVLLLTLLALPAQAQLIAPGKLTAAHARFEGLSGCTNCHALGQRGIEPQKCLACHTPLRARIRRDEGFHATTDRDCGTCHKDHFGRDFDPARFDTDAFDHRKTGYPLLGEHAGADCGSCHQSQFITAADVRAFKLAAGRLDETYLGLANDCATCHRRENPHGSDFSVDCQSCHNPRAWEQVSDFDHTTTGFALVGQHVSLSCTSCHGETASGTIQFADAEPACATCHRPDSPHGTQFRGQDCATCHDAQTWKAAPNFTHARADFPLTGRHLRIDCASCHTTVAGRTQFEGIAHETCQSCHEDQHDGTLGTDCATCHTTAGWQQMGRTFADDRFDHAAATGFPLIGAHADAACAACHATPARNDGAYRITFAGDARGVSFPPVVADDCQSCHKDYHDGAFTDLPGGTLCASCHGQDGWLPASFGIERHNAETTFVLAGAHLATPCFACHGGQDAPPHFDFETTACEGCHAEENPHGEQFADETGATVCGGCHTPSAWDLADFDHATTGFPLTGRHSVLDCQSCHTPVTSDDGQIVHTLTGLDAACATCHTDDDPHRGQFEDESCAACHGTQDFMVASFDHDRTRFPLIGAHTTATCGACHKMETAPDGASFVRFKPLSTACADCHGGS